MVGARLRRADTAVPIGGLVEELIVGLDVGGRLRLRVLANPIVAGDRQALQRAFLELLANALAHNSPRGIVRVTVGELGSGVFVEVQDEECSAHRIDPSPCSGAGPTSQSPSMETARGVVEAHGGGLRCIDEIERLLLVYLPLARVA